MAIFDGAIKTKTRVRLDKDKFQPGMGVLGAASETEQALIHGNQKEQVFGKHERYVDLTTEIVLNGAVKVFMMNTCLWTVIGNTNINFLANYTLLVGGTTMQTYIGNVMNTYLAGNINTHIGARVGTHAAPHQNVDPTTWLDVVNSWTQLVPVKQTIGGYKNDVFGVAMTFSGAKVDVAGARGAVNATELRTTGQKAAAELAKAEAGALKGRIEAMSSKLGALQADAQARVNALPTVSTSAPFGA